MFKASLEGCQQRINKLRYSVEKNSHQFPVTAQSVGALTDEQEDISDKSNRDKTLLMEKLGAIQSAEAFGTAAVLRNKFSHHYPEVNASRMERLNMVMEEAHFVMASFEEITAYLSRKGFVA